MRLLFLPFVLALTAAAPGTQPRNEAAVIAADDAWLKAEVAGDAAFLNELLLPDYVSIGAEGKTTLKSRIVANAGARDAAARAKLAAAVSDWKASHPVKAEVTISGDTAILKWVLVGKDNAVSSVDTFVYRGGRWRALYSQHSSAAN